MKKFFAISVILVFVLSASAFCDKPIVSIVKGTDVDQEVRKAIEMLGGMALKVKKQDRVAIKVSLDEAASAESGKVTNVEVVRALVRMAKEAGARRVTIMDGSLKGNTWKAFDAAGYSKMAKEEGAELKDLDSDLVWRAWLPEGDKGYKKYSVAQTILMCEVFIDVPVMKAGDPNSPSLALKNMLGVMCDRWAKRRLPEGDKLDTLIVDLNLIKQSDLVVIDATKYGGFVMAAADPVSADTVACKYLKIDPAKIGYLKMAADKGLGIDSVSDIDVKYATL